MEKNFLKAGQYLRLSHYVSTLLFFTAIAVEAADKPKSPSDCRPDSCPSVTFVLSERSDLRTLFCSPEVLMKRIEQSICIVDKINGPSQTISIQTGETISTVIKKLKQDCGLPLQMRLITKDMIKQTDLTLRSPCDDAEFMNLAVNPGDFIVIAARQ